MSGRLSPERLAELRSWRFSRPNRVITELWGHLDAVEQEKAQLVEAGKHVVMEWRLHGQLTDSCRVMEAALAAVDGAQNVDAGK